MTGLVDAGRTALIVDDDPVFVTFVSALLSRYRVTVVAAVSDLASAQQALEAYAPSCAVVDIRLPDGLGFELMASAVEAGLETRVVFVTAEQELAEHAPPGVRVLLKPLTAVELAEAII